MRSLPPMLLLAALVTTAGASMAGSAARAEDGNDDEFARRLLAGTVAKAKPHACFVRRYDATHLAQHRLQKVSAMKLLVTAEKGPEDEALHYSFSLAVKLRHRPGRFETGGGCGHGTDVEAGNKAQLGCGVDCDGGGIEIELMPDDKAVLVRIESVRLSRIGKDDEPGFTLEGGADDRVFRLDRASLDDCASLVSDKAELAALRQ